MSETRLPVGARVKWSDTALRSKRERVGTVGGRQGDLYRRWYEEAKAKRGTILAHAFAQADSPIIGRKRGDFIGYDVHFDGESESAVHSTAPYMVALAED